MATNREERLEVAERLRDYSHALSSDTCDEFYMRLNMALFGDGGLARPDSGIFRRLADLIEPEPEQTCHDARERGSYFRCSRCGAFLADGAVTNATNSIAVRYCPNCGARVVND